jgi:predicted dithiol-disulfide oxidoreductase (DUF899 family)
MTMFPGESDEYRKARNQLLEAEMALRRQVEAVAEQRRALPLGGVPREDYGFEEWDPAACGSRAVRLSELFADGTDTLFLYSFMFNPDQSGRPLRVACPLCTSMMDGIDGELPHIAQRISFAAAAKAPIERFGAHAHTRGWRNLRLLSSAGTTYNRDYRAEASDAEQRPMATVFTRQDGTIRHFWSSELILAPMEPGQSPRHVDFMWPLWAVLDRTPGGRGADWYPRLAYDG